MKHNFKLGETVRIKSINHSEDTQGTNFTMENMVGNKYRVDSVGRNSVQLNDYYWDPRDLRHTEIKEKPKPQIFHFDETTLEGLQ